MWRLQLDLNFKLQFFRTPATVITALRVSGDQVLAQTPIQYFLTPEKMSFFIHAATVYMAV